MATIRSTKPAAIGQRPRAAKTRRDLSVCSLECLRRCIRSASEKPPPAYDAGIKNQGEEAPSFSSCHCPRCGYSGARWRYFATFNAVRQISVLENAVRECRLSEAAIPDGISRKSCLMRKPRSSAGSSSVPCSTVAGGSPKMERASIAIPQTSSLPCLLGAARRILQSPLSGSRRGEPRQACHPVLVGGRARKPPASAALAAQLGPIVQPLADLALEAALRRIVECVPAQPLGKIILARERIGRVMVVRVRSTITLFLHHLGRGVENVLGRHQ